jgi:hypothetical protein
MTQRNTQRGDAMAIGMIVLAIALVAAVGFIAWQNFGSKDSEKADTVALNEGEKKDDEKKEPEDPYKNWKTYRGSLTGVTLKYPADWVVTSNGEEFTNDGGGKRTTFTVMSTERTGSYGGHDANTYMCLSVDEYSTAGWYGQWDIDANDLTRVTEFKANDATTLAIAKVKSKTEGGDMLSSLNAVTSGGSRNIPVSSENSLNVNAQFNCVQGDFAAIRESQDVFMDRRETKDAVKALESLRF